MRTCSSIYILRYTIIKSMVRKNIGCGIRMSSLNTIRWCCIDTFYEYNDFQLCFINIPTIYSLLITQPTSVSSQNCCKYSSWAACFSLLDPPCSGHPTWQLTAGSFSDASLDASRLPESASTARWRGSIQIEIFNSNIQTYTSKVVLVPGNL